MSNLSIDLTAEMIPGLISALESYRESSEGAESVLFAALYDRRFTLIDYAVDLSALRDIESAALSRDLTDTEDAILHKLRGSACHWIHNKAGQILAEIARNPLAEPDTRPAYLGRPTA